MTQFAHATKNPIFKTAIKGICFAPLSMYSNSIERGFMKLQSDAFLHRQAIPQLYTGEGENLSPALIWENEPAGTRQFAISCLDPDAPIRPGKDHPFVHWLIYNIPESVHRLPQGLATKEELEQIPATQGQNSFGNIGYGGPMPPIGHGVHHYEFSLYALDTILHLAPGLRMNEFIEKIRGHVLFIAKLKGTYERVPKQNVAKEKIA
jgi:Raf kinase inhibitor-like YbhB/YbcL family protein